MFYIIMSAEKIISTELKVFPPLETPKKSKEVSSSARVDINHLLARVRKKDKEENRINIIFFGMLATLILIVGILLSL